LIEIVEILKPYIKEGTGGVFLILFIYMLYQLRKDQAEHKAEYKEVIKQMFQVVDKNTESHSKLCSSIDTLKDRLR